MDCEPIEIIRVIRRMRGGSCAYLVEGNDGHCYVAKFRGNPQGTRTLINEWFASQLFQQLSISTPPLRVLRLSRAVQEATTDFVFPQGSTRIAVEPGLHLGSQCPVNPERAAIFDFLPSRRLWQVVNPEDFAKALVLDLFLAQTDSRQAIFVREQGGQGAPRFRAYLIDHGWTLGGSLWQLDTSLRRWYFNRTIYSFFNLPVECERALHLVSANADRSLYEFGKNVPRIWFSKGDDVAWARLLDSLLVRKGQLPQLLNYCLQTLGQQEQSDVQAQMRMRVQASSSPEQRIADIITLPAVGELFV